MADKFPAMLSHKFNAKKYTADDYPVVVEPKLDGIRCLIILKHCEDEEDAWYDISVYSRAGKPFTSLEAIEDMICDTFGETGWEEDMVFDGEVFCGDFKTTVSQVKRKSEQAVDAVYTIFDIIPLSEFEEGSTAFFDERRTKLVEFFAAAPPSQKKLQLSKAVLANSVDEVHDLYAKARDMGHEGVIVKFRTGEKSRWVPKRSWGWMKIKDKQTADCKIIGAEEGEGRLEKTLGAIVIDYKGTIVNVGTGFTDDERHKLWRLHKKGKLKGLTVEVSYHEETPDGSLRHPAFEHIRIDK
jgi:DNA ligase-1